MNRILNLFRPGGGAEDDWAVARARMVAEQLRGAGRGITDGRLDGARAV